MAVFWTPRSSAATTIAVWVLALCVSISNASRLSFSTGFSSDMVLQRGPARAAVYGLAVGSGKIQVTVTNDKTGETYTVDATQASAGIRAPMCSERCLGLDAASSCRGSVSACLLPSCAQGCRIGRYTDLNTCRAACSAHVRQDKGAEWPFSLNDDEGTNCDTSPWLGGCPTKTACEAGCELAHNTSATGDSTSAWKVYLRPAPAGGSYTVVAFMSSADGADAASRTLHRVTFGDVYFCSGQSNMELSTTYTFSRPASVAAIRSGKYSNIRFFHMGDMGTRYSERDPAFATTSGGPLQPFNASNVTIEPVSKFPYTPGSGGYWWNVTYATSLRLPPNSREGSARVRHVHGDLRGAYRRVRSGDEPATQNPFDALSAVCYYFAQALTDALGDDAPPIGLIESAVGGTKIEEWLSNSTKNKCTEEALSETSSYLYSGMVAPFVNTTIRGVLWYQGENNCGDTPGNSQNKSGYGCEIESLVSSWREAWSVEPETTSKQLAFGIVGLAPDGSEGFGQNIAAIRWSQQANFGTWPSTGLPGTFGANAFDLADPWTHNTQTDANFCSKKDPKTGKYGKDCIWNPARWAAPFKPLLGAIRNNTAPIFMGSIHPRLKYPVGRRLAVAAMRAVYGDEAGPVAGPTIAGCAMSSDSTSLRLLFNATALGNERLSVRQFDANMSNWADTDSASLMVCVGDGTAASRGQCASADPYFHGDGNGWQAAPVTLGSESATIDVDLSRFELDNMTVVAVRYGWPLGDSTCCPQKDAASGLAPCVPGACPIVTENTGLPANPFYANVVGGKCRCLNPQRCDASVQL